MTSCFWSSDLISESLDGRALSTHSLCNTAFQVIFKNEVIVSEGINFSKKKKTRNNYVHVRENIINKKANFVSVLSILCDALLADTYCYTFVRAVEHNISKF